MDTLKAGGLKPSPQGLDPAGSDLPDRHLFPLLLPCFGASGPGFEAPCRQPEGHRWSPYRSDKDCLDLNVQSGIWTNAGC